MMMTLNHAWAQRFADVAELEGEEWEAECERLKDDWLTAYADAFVAGRAWLPAAPRA